MNPDNILDTEAEVSQVVTEEMCPALDGVVVHRVYSTWSMGHHMELAARRVILPHLEPDEEGVGTHLSIDHSAPLPVGKTARVVARCVEATRSTVVCEVAAYDGHRLIGRGRHVHRVLSRRTLNAWIARHR